MPRFFYKHPHTRDGLDTYCIPCKKEIAREHYNPERQRERYYADLQNNRNKHAAWTREWRKNNPKPPATRKPGRPPKPKSWDLTKNVEDFTMTETPK